MDNTIKKVIKNYINEYYADQRLPFDDDFYGKKNQMEQYVDWLEDFGKYGNLPPSTLDFKEEINKTIDTLLNKTINVPLPNSKEEILEQLDNSMFKYLKFNKSGNLYVERSIELPNNAESTYEIYHQLIDDYQNNVGGCWSYREGMSNTYCSNYDYGAKAKLKGFIRTDDIDFMQTIILNFQYNDEFEIRVKPLAKVALFEFSINDYSHTFKNPLIVSATYFGNGGKYDGEYAKIDNGFGSYTPINRKGKIVKIPSGCEFQATTNVGLIIIKKEDYATTKNRYNLINQNGDLISNQWFYSISQKFSDGYAVVSIYDDVTHLGYNYIDVNGNFLLDKNYRMVHEFSDGIAVVCDKNEGNNIINTNGKFLSEYWLNDAYTSFSPNLILVRRKEDNLYNLIQHSNGVVKKNYVSNQWFYNIDTTNMVNIFKVESGSDSEPLFNYLKIDGELLSNEWFYFASPNFYDGYAIVLKKMNGVIYFLDMNGNLKKTMFISRMAAWKYLMSLSENTIFKSSVRKVLDEIKNN